MFRKSAHEALLAATPQALSSLRRRAEEAERAARGGDLDILIGYDLRFWRELTGLVGNPYLSDFLQRLRMQTWVFTVPFLRAVPDLRGRLWAGHREISVALTQGDADAVEQLIAAYNADSIGLVERLAAGADWPRPQWGGEN